MFIVCMIILVFFAAIGIATFITSIMGAVTKTNQDDFIFIVPNIQKDTAEMRLRRAATVRDNLSASRMICVIDDDEGTKCICEKLKDEYPFIEIMTKNEVREII